MPLNRYKELPLDTLYELIVQTVGRLLQAADEERQDFNAILKDLHLIYAAIQEKSKKQS